MTHTSYVLMYDKKYYLKFRPHMKYDGYENPLLANFYGELRNAKTKQSELKKCLTVRPYVNSLDFPKTGLTSITMDVDKITVEEIEVKVESLQTV